VLAQFMGKAFLRVAMCLLVASLGATSSLKAAPVYAPGPIFPAGSVNAFDPLVLSESQTPSDFEWTESTPPDIAPGDQRSLRGTIFFALLVGSMLRFLISDAVRRFFQETFNPMNWSSYD
jgi:hypothetical protein